MPNINEFIGPKPQEVTKEGLEKIIGNKPCSKCDKNSNEYFWDPANFVISWTCPDNHNNYVKVNS
jgi:hypothetical protein